MTVPKVKNYKVFPTTLTKTYWKGQKKVGTVGGEPPSVYALAQAKINTGLGVALDNAEAAWKKIKWNTLNATLAVDPEAPDGLAAIQQAKVKAHAYITGTEFADAIAKLATAKTKATAAGKHKLLSKKANDAAKAIATGLQTQANMLASIDLSDFDSSISDWKRYLAAFDDRYEDALAKVDQSLQAYSATPNKATWDRANMLSRCSEVGTVVKQAKKAQMARYVPYDGVWTNINSTTQQIHQAYEGQGVSAANAAKYVRQMNQYLLQVPAF
jgi:hypothetical protein